MTGLVPGRGEQARAGLRIEIIFCITCTFSFSGTFNRLVLERGAPDELGSYGSLLVSLLCGKTLLEDVMAQGGPSQVAEELWRERGSASEWVQG